MAGYLVELVGGPHDGEQLTIDGEPDEIVLPTTTDMNGQAIPLALHDDEAGLAIIVIRAAVYVRPEKMLGAGGLNRYRFKEIR